MKIIFTIILFCFSIELLFAQQPIVLWNQHFGGTGDDEGLAIAPDKHGGFIVASVSNSTNYDVTCDPEGSNVAFLMKFDSSHNLVWKNCYMGVAYSINPTNDGGYVFAGFSDSASSGVSCNHGAQDFSIVKIDSNGNQVATGKLIAE